LTGFTLYIVEPGYWASQDTSRRQWIAIRAALEDLSARLRLLETPLIIRIGEPTDVLRTLHSQQGIGAIHAQVALPDPAPARGYPGRLVQMLTGRKRRRRGRNGRAGLFQSAVPE
jgi:hypothetical protein